MRQWLRKLGVRVALLVTKSFVYLWGQAKHLHLPHLPLTVRTAGNVALYAGLRLILPIYNAYRRTRRAVAAFVASGGAPLTRALTHRYALHAAVVALALLTTAGNLATRPAGAESFGRGSLIFSFIESDEGFAAESPAGPAGLTAPDDGASANEAPSRTFLSYHGDAVFQPYLPTTESSVAPRQQIETYVVETGDTLASIAIKFRIQLQTVLLANNLGSRSIIRPGQKLTILPVDGLLHTVRRGERLGTIASAYRVTPEAIVSFNRLPNERSLLAGQVLIVPGGRPVPAAAVARARPTAAGIPAAAVDTGTRLLWPGSGRRITQYFTWRHSGVDIGLPFGTPIYAAESGTVVEARWGGGYGNMVVIRHDNGLTTRYGHASRLLVSPGERVARGQVVALVGSTGRSTGPHIHFEVIVGGRRVNPLSYTR